MVSEAGFKVSGVSYSELVAFPMSGGYVGPAIVPKSPRFLGSALLAVDAGMLSLLSRLSLGRFLGWRYLLVADAS